MAVLDPLLRKKIDVIAVGRRKILKLGENGDVDVMFVHSPKVEEEFAAAGFGIDRVPLCTMILLSSVLNPIPLILNQPLAQKKL